MRRRLILTADDFGLSPEVNEAVERAHREGVLTAYYGNPRQVFATLTAKF